jgi:hypothetical protein
VLKSTNKILIALSFWKGDKSEAMLLARLLADLEPQYSTIADFAFVARQDCKHDRDTVGYVAKKFNTHTVTSNRPETGWPNGCNGVFFGLVDWTLRGISSAKIPAYSAIFVCASDTAPITRDAIQFIYAQWNLLQSRRVSVAGAMVPTSIAGPDKSHINGDCFLMSGHPDFLFWLAKRAGQVIRRGGGFDWILAPEFEQRGWANIPEIVSHYRRPPFAEGEWETYVNQGIKWVHGVKGSSLLQLARKKLL